MRYDQKFIAIDTETGGLPSKLKKQATIEVALTEIAAVTIDNEKLEIIGKDSWLIKPYDKDLIYDKYAEIASGISKQMCEKDGIDIEKAYNGLKKVLVAGKKGKSKPIIIFQNKDFDIPFLENLFKIFEDDFWEHIDRIEDTLYWARLKWVEKPNYKLGSIAQYCGLDHTQAHRALPDTIITAEVWISFIKSLRNESSSAKPTKEKKFRHSFKF